MLFTTLVASLIACFSFALFASMMTFILCSVSLNVHTSFPFHYFLLMSSSVELCGI
nr:MAG TPA: hypothetical protein [Caudoviricetes sp.]